MGGDDDQERRAQLKARLREIARELDDIMQELGEVPDEPGERRKRFILYPGGLAGIGAIAATTRWTRQHARAVAASSVAAGGVAALAAAVLAHPGAAPYPLLGRHPAPHERTAASAPMSPTADASSLAHPRPPKPHVTLPPVLPPPVRRRSAPAVPGSSAPSPSEPPPPTHTPPPAAEPSRSPSPPTGTPTPSSSPTPAPSETLCLIDLDVTVLIPILSVCL